MPDRFYDVCPKRFGDSYLYNVANDFRSPLHFGYASFIVENAQKVENVERTQYVFNRFLSAGAQRTLTPMEARPRLATPTLCRPLSVRVHHAP